ncbi:MAG: BON domain-containing protein [Blastocatellia bacterium]|nr:BON domain-containing protein [Blastocatellia bacterium]
MTLKYVSLYFGAVVISAMATTACDTTTTTNTNANMANVNSNTAVVVNATPTNTATNTNTNWNSNMSRDDYDRSRADYERDRGDSRIGTGANDSWLWFKTRAALMTTSDLRESTINVDVENEVVTLRGTVANAAQRTRAETTAKGIDGVKSVRNQLTVSADDSMTNMSGGNANGNMNR